MLEQTDNKPETQHRSGELAYFDSLFGLVPVKVISVEVPGNGRKSTSGRIRYKVTAARPGYPKGYEGTSFASRIVPRTCVHGSLVISTYEWISNEED